MSESHSISESGAKRFDHNKSLFARLGIAARRTAGGPVWLEPAPSLCNNGAVRPSIVVLMVDMIAGFVAESYAEGDWVVTTDLSVRTPLRTIPARVDCNGELLRIGRNTVSSTVRLIAADQPFGYGVAGFARLPRRYGDPPRPHLHEDDELLHLPTITRPVVEEVGIEVADASRGAVSVEMRDALRNPVGAMQGAIVSLVAEVAAEALAEHGRGVPQIVTGLDIRYVAMARTGPVTSTAEWIGGDGSGQISVVLRDRGNEDRIIAQVLAQAEDA